MMPGRTRRPALYRPLCRRLHTASRWAWSPLLTAVVGVCLAYLLAAWLDCSTQATDALCLAPLGLQQRWLSWRLHRARQRVKRAMAAQLLAADELLHADRQVLGLIRQLRDASHTPGGRHV